MQAALGNMARARATPDVHFEDTVKGADWGCDQDVARLFVNLAPVAVRQMAYWGVPWNRVVAGPRTSPTATSSRRLEEKEASSPPATSAAPRSGGPASVPTAPATPWSTPWTTWCWSWGWRSTTARGAGPHPRRRPATAPCRDLRTGELRVYVARPRSSPPVATAASTALHQRRHQRRQRHGHRPGHGRGAAGEHGGGAVPPHGRRARRHPGHRGLPRRRRQPAGQERASLHARLRAGEEGARLPRRGEPAYGPPHASGPRRRHALRAAPLAGHPPPGPRAHREEPARRPGDLPRLPGPRPGRSLIPVRPTQHYSMGGVRTDIGGGPTG